MRYPFAEAITDLSLMNVYDGVSRKARAVLDVEGLFVDSMSVTTTDEFVDWSIVNPSEYITFYDEEDTYIDLNMKNDAYSFVVAYESLNGNGVMSGNVYSEWMLQIYPYSLNRYNAIEDVVTRMGDCLENRDSVCLDRVREAFG
jgi:hypothetical protein